MYRYSNKFWCLYFCPLFICGPQKKPENLKTRYVFVYRMSQSKEDKPQAIKSYQNAPCYYMQDM